MKQLITILLILPLIFMASCDPGKGENIILDVSSSVLSFNAVSVGSSDTQTFTLKNIGDANVEITSMNIVLEGENISEELYKIDNDLKFPIIIKKGEEFPEEIRVVYTAFDILGDNVSGKIVIKSNDSIKPEKSVFLKSEKANPKLKVSVDSIVFDTLNIGESSEIELIVSNTGTSQLKFEQLAEDGSITATNGDAVSFGQGTNDSFELIDLSNVRTLEPTKFEDGEEVYDNFTIKVKYTASGEGTETGTLILHNNSTNASPKKIINIMASSEACNLILDPVDGYLDFGEQPIPGVDDPKASYNATLSNIGTFDCSLNKLELDTENSSPEFSIELPENTDLPLIIKPNERVTFKVVFIPTNETGAGGASGIINIESNDKHWNNGKKQLTLYGRSKENTDPVCIIKNLQGGEAYFEVEPGQIENVECNGPGICSNVQMVSHSYDPNPDRDGTLTHIWSMIESPAAYRPTWFTNPSTDHNNVSNADKHYLDAYIPFATPSGSRYLIELKIIAQDGTSSVCYAEAYGLTGNSLHVELFWDLPSDVDLHVMNPTDQNLSVNNIDIENPSLDPDLENWRSRTNSEWWSGYGTTGTGRDCHYSNCKSGVAWGVPGENDDPSLDRDDITGTGPENINVAAPKEGWYRVSIHYFSSSDEGTDAHTRIYCNGVVAYQNSTFLKNTNETWLVNDIYWEDLGNGDGRCTIFSDGRIYSERQGSGAAGYKGNLIEDIEPDNE